MLMFRRQTPHALISVPNPVFDYELNHVRRLSTPESLKRFSLFILLGLNIPIAALWILYLVLNSPATTSPFGISNIVPFLSFVQGLNLLIPIGADLYYVSISANSINRQIDSGHWEMLHLTHMREQDMITATH